MSEARTETRDTPLRLLLITSDSTLPVAIERPLVAEAVAVPVVIGLGGGRTAVELLRGSSFDMIVADTDALSDLADRTEAAIGKLARLADDALLLALTPTSSISASLGAMRAGAHDCVVRSVSAEALVQRLVELARRHGKAAFFCASPAIPMESSDLSSDPPSIPVMRNLVLPMWRQEQQIIEDAIQTFAGNIALAAAALELSPSTIYRKRQAWAELDQKRAALGALAAG